MGDFSNVVLFKNEKGEYVSYEDLLRNIYDNTQETRNSIEELVIKIVPMMKETSDAVILLDMVTNLLGVRVKNDDLLIKVAAIVSRMMGKLDTKSPELEISKEDRDQLLKEINDEAKKRRKEVGKKSGVAQKLLTAEVSK